ncbi:unnamed protein product [Rotaria socialis]|uniref:Uncharacterized protein n=1 Tax=Rotaria socialis TaxID=392032 RepID=A0A817VT05_9BILA|nr:unnamed protein product [Rotaria socialis]
MDRISPRNNEYHIDEDGHFNESYYDKLLKYTACVDGETLNAVQDECYVTLVEAIEDIDNIPFEINNVRELAVFDCVKCQNDEEIDQAHSMHQAGFTFQNIAQAIQK